MSKYVSDRARYFQLDLEARRRKQANEFEVNNQSSFYRSVNDIERVPRSNLARLLAISSLWTLFVGIHATERKSCTGVHEGHSTAAVQRLSSVAVFHCRKFARGLLHVMYAQYNPSFSPVFAVLFTPRLAPGQLLWAFPTVRLYYLWFEGQGEGVRSNPPFWPQKILYTPQLQLIHFKCPTFYNTALMPMKITTVHQFGRLTCSWRTSG